MNHERDEVWLDEPDPKVEEALDRQFKRIGPLRWRVRTGYFQKFLSFINAIKSGRTTKEIAAERLSICNSCPKLRLVAGRKFCGGCSCGSWMLAQLDGGPVPKLEWADLKCPEHRW